MATNFKVIGRQKEKDLLDRFLEAKEPEFLAIYGRRRVGKTHLIREHCGPKAEIFFTVTGQKDATYKQQLFHFKQQLEQVFYQGAPLPELASWESAFRILCDAIEAKQDRGVSGPILIFLDELPWLSTKRSGLIQALDHTWNTRMSRMKQLKLIVCGSAASWMLENLINAKGGLHNRINRRIRLEPFTLKETAEYLSYRKVKTNKAQVVELFMAFGGVPFYLQQVEKGRSAAQNISASCFDPSGVLSDEYQRLFASLYTNAEVHDKIVRVIAKKREGILRDDLIRTIGLSSGGRLLTRLAALEEAGFIGSFVPYGNKKRLKSYRLIDEFIGFHLKWIEKAPRGVLADNGLDYWMAKAQTPSYRAWAGFTYEGICLKHAGQIKKALGIEGIAAEVATWRHVPQRSAREDKGVQIDLIFDRADGVINVCEIKYSDGLFQVDKKYATELKRKLLVFEDKMRTPKNILLTLVTTHGLKKNVWSEGLVDSVVTLNDLFA
jgi:predicted AAA+ superfamily ATPase